MEKQPKLKGFHQYTDLAQSLGWYSESAYTWAKGKNWIESVEGIGIIQTPSGTTEQFAASLLNGIDSRRYLRFDGDSYATEHREVMTGLDAAMPKGFWHVSKTEQIPPGEFEQIIMNPKWQDASQAEGSIMQYLDNFQSVEICIFEDMTIIPDSIYLIWSCIKLRKHRSTLFITDIRKSEIMQEIMSGMSEARPWMSKAMELWPQWKRAKQIQEKLNEIRIVEL